MRREYQISLIVNEQLITHVVIDPHYEKKHGASISDAIILELVKTLKHEDFFPEEIRGCFSYYSKDRIWLHEKMYKLVWLTEEHKTYIGVINAYRR
jgi:hypothetical protein